jgi:hypothetical protein
VAEQAVDVGTAKRDRLGADGTIEGDEPHVGTLLADTLPVVHEDTADREHRLPVPVTERLELRELCAKFDAHIAEFNHRVDGARGYELLGG